MFISLSRILLWLLIGALFYYVFGRAFPSQSAVGRTGIVILLIILVLAFLTPNDGVVGSLWNVLSFPLKPLGAAIVLLFLAAQNIGKDGNVKAPGGGLILWALVIIMFSSTPAIAYLLTRVPQVRVVSQGSTPGLVSTFNLSVPTQIKEILASGPEATTDLYAPQLDRDIGQASAFNFVNVSTAAIGADLYLSQVPTTTTTSRGLRLQDFVPNAETLTLTTRVWEGYLGDIYNFLRGQRPRSVR
jgi:hypothetical protein